MRKLIYLWLVSSITATSWPAVANDIDDAAADINKAMAKYNFTPAQRAAALKKAGKAKENKPPEPPNALPPEREKKATCPNPGWVPLLRQDWKDIGYLECPQGVDKATGAQVAVTNDHVKRNVNWALQGVAGVLYNSGSTGVGAYVSANRSINSAQSLASKNIDTLGFGGFLQYGVTHNKDNSDYFRIRGGAVHDNIKDTTIASVAGEWSPVKTKLFHSPIDDYPPFIFRFDPVLLIQYSAVSGKGQTLAFNGRDEALRVGPQATLRVFGGTDPFWKNLVASISYHWAYETYSGRGLNLYQTSVTYNIGDSGNVGLTASYQRGHDEDIGTWVSLYKIGLTGKI
jgi:hypothetical protein